MQTPAGAVGALSPDGYWRWDGTQWRLANPTGPPSPASGSRRSILAILGVVVAVVAELVILASYLVPYVHYDASGGYQAYDYAVFYGCTFYGDSTTCGNTPMWWNVATGSAMVTFGIALAVLVMAFKGRIWLAAGAAALMALGIQELSDWVSYVTVLQFPGAHASFGLLIGLIGTAVLFGGGLMVAISVATSERSS